MREFDDAEGRRWRAEVAERQGPDYKGRFHLVMTPTEGRPDEVVELIDVRWNSESTAIRTLRTASDVELRRRLRSALGRARVIETGLD